MTILPEIKASARIADVWRALGGGELRHGRGRAWWRNGDGFNIALDAERGVWFDHVTGEGGDCVTLVETVLRCDFRVALRWLSEHTGVPVSPGIQRSHGEADTDWRGDLERATWWSMIAEDLAEQCLADLSHNDPLRPDLTDLLRMIRFSDATLVNVYRAWRRSHPELTMRMTRDGRLYDAGVQRDLAHWLRRFFDGSQAA